LEIRTWIRRNWKDQTTIFMIKITIAIMATTTIHKVKVILTQTPVIIVETQIMVKTKDSIKIMETIVEDIKTWTEVAIQDIITIMTKIIIITTIITHKIKTTAVDLMEAEMEIWIKLHNITEAWIIRAGNITIICLMAAMEVEMIIILEVLQELMKCLEIQVTWWCNNLKHKICKTSMGKTIAIMRLRAKGIIEVIIKDITFNIIIIMQPKM